MRVKFKRIIAATALLTVVSGITAFAASSETLARGGYAYLNASYSSGLRMVDGGTIPGDPNHYSSLYVLTTYDNGSTYEYSEPLHRGKSSYTSTWEWAEDYASIHKVGSSNENVYDSAKLSDS